MGPSAIMSFCPGPSARAKALAQDDRFCCWWDEGLFVVGLKPHASTDSLVGSGA